MNRAARRAACPWCGSLTRHGVGEASCPRHDVTPWCRAYTPGSRPLTISEAPTGVVARLLALLRDLAAEGAGRGKVRGLQVAEHEAARGRDLRALRQRVRHRA